MRIIGKLLLLLLLAGCSTNQVDPARLPTENRYIPEEDFLRISEYFTGREPQTDRVPLRSNPDARGGYYWILPVDASLVEAQPIRIDLWVHRPGSPETLSFTLRPERTLDTDQTLWIGLTGEDWPNEELGPIAWKIEVTSPEEKTLLVRRSFLWPEDSGSTGSRGTSVGAPTASQNP